MDDVSKYKTEEHINFVTISYGIYEGVSYKINEAKFVEKNGKDYIELDYDVKDLAEGKELEFEQYMGNLMIEALKYAVKNDKSNEEIQV